MKASPVNTVFVKAWNMTATQVSVQLSPGTLQVHFDCIPLFHCSEVQLAVQVKHIPTSPLEITYNQLVLKQDMAWLFPDDDKRVAQRDCVFLGANMWGDETAKGG